MTKGTKILIGVVITIFSIIGLIVGGLVGLFFAFDRSNTERMQKEAQAEIDGREFGKTTDQNGCMEKGFTIPDKHFLMTTYKFIGACLESSRPTPDFCNGVPLTNDFTKQSNWEDEQCQKFDPENKSCRIAFSQKISFCKRADENKSK